MKGTNTSRLPAQHTPSHADFLLRTTSTQQWEDPYDEDLMGTASSTPLSHPAAEEFTHRPPNDDIEMGPSDIRLYTSELWSSSGSSDRIASGISSHDAAQQGLHSQDQNGKREPKPAHSLHPLHSGESSSTTTTPLKPVCTPRNQVPLYTASVPYSTPPSHTTTTTTISTSNSAAYLDYLNHFPNSMSKAKSMLEITLTTATSSQSDDSPHPSDYRSEKKLLYKEALMAGPLEVSDARSEARTECHIRNFFLAATMGIIFSLVALGYKNLIPKIISQGEYVAIPIALIIPISAFFASFSIMVAVSSAINICMGPVRLLRRNNPYYSFHRTPHPPGIPLPPVVIQMPVYKEDLHEVIVPTYRSVERAMRRYQQAGGRVAFMICDDGLQLISDEDATSRIAFYAKHHIGFVARPKDNRRGLFKKASNMNYTLRIVQLTKEKMDKQPGMSSQEAISEVWREFNEEFVAGGDIRILDDAIILLIDADTRVPENCIVDTMGEFMSTPNLPYTQHFTQPFDEQKRNYWEEMISFFTEKIYFAGLLLTCASGGYAPLVGHNAFLRWSSVRQVAFDCPDEKFTKYWSEDTVSEDFDLFMRFAAQNMFGRYVVYTGPEFQEGVSLSYMDEVIKLRKFTYGACEMVFNPLKHWVTKGPFTKLYRNFVGSKRIAWTEKCSVTFYLSTYFAMGAAFYFTLWEAVCSVMLPDFFDRYLVRGFDVMITINFTFGVFATAASIILMWRINALNQKHRIGLFRIIWNEVKWCPACALFFSSILFHITTAAFCYFFSLKIVWGATVKEQQNPSSLQALKETFEAYWKEYCFLGFLLALYMGVWYYYQLTFYTGWGLMFYLLLQLVGPVLLNPHITSLTY